MSMEVIPYPRVVFTWGWESEDSALSALTPGSSAVEFDLESKDGGTLLRFRHSGLGPVEYSETPIGFAAKFLFHFHQQIPRANIQSGVSFGKSTQNKQAKAGPEPPGMNS